MIQLELGGERWPLATGETVIGSSPAAAVRLEHAGVLPRHALVHAAAAGAAGRRTPEVVATGRLAFSPGRFAEVEGKFR